MNTRSGGRVWGILVAVAMQAAAVGQPTERRPVPDEAAVAAAGELIRQAFSAQQDSLADSLEDLLPQTQDVAQRYALFLEAEAALLAGGDTAAAMKLIDQRAEEFEVDGIAARLAAITKLLTPAARKNYGQLEALFGQSMETTDRALAAEKMDRAREAADLVQSIAKSLSAVCKSETDDERAMLGEIKNTAASLLVKAVRKRADAFTKYEIARNLLEGNEDDGAANKDVGCYLCFKAGKWDQGLAALAKSDFKDAAEIAAAEIAIAPSSSPGADKVFAVAEKWWAAAEKEKFREDAVAIRTHAGRLYESAALTSSNPLQKVVAQQKAEQARREAAGKPELIEAQKRAMPREALRFGGHTYFFFPGPATQSGATARCEALGGHLVRFDNQAEFDAVAKKADKLFSRGAFGDKGNSMFWADGRLANPAKVETAEGWQLGDGKPLGYLVWRWGRPSRYGSGLSFVIDAQKAAMAQCDSEQDMHFICEWDWDGK